ncbi:DUF3006 domain-containing protein [Patescibacteria group bacterium]|nr:DUF3006 domain-containing protein [Patescibacteria group bacterium]MBU4511756.1 DUF3006 domain-containing protein [Patescibacteria group bacterium]
MKNDLSNKKNNDAFESDNRPFIKGVVDCFENEQAVIQTDDKQKIIWPRENLPADIKEGMGIKLFLSTDAMEARGREEIVKDLLNQILKKST